MKPDPMSQHPHKWLLNELRAILSDDQYTTLLTAHDRVKTRYNTTAKLRHERALLNSYRRAYANASSDRKANYALRIQHKEARIRRLEQELKQYADA